MTDLIGSFLKEITNDNVIIPKVYSKTVLSNETKNKLLSYQTNHVIRMITILLKYNIALDSSDTGIGKTYSSCAVCKEMDRKPIIICPKILIFNWVSVLSYFGVKYYDIVNYETLKNGKTYSDNEYKKRKKSPFVDVIDIDPEDTDKFVYQWQVPDDAIIIFDEVHRCKDPCTENGKLFASTKQLIRKKIPVLGLSATICEKFKDMKILFYLFGLIPNTKNFNHYTKTLEHKYPQHKIRRKNHTTKISYEIAKDNSQAIMIHEEIKEYISRIRIKDLGNKFPSNQWCAQQFFAEESEKISEAYKEIAIHLKALKENPGKNHLAKIQKLKQEIEFRKIPIFIDQAESYLNEGKSVIIFVNFLNTLQILSIELSIRCKIYGAQTIQERQKSIDLFQSNQERIIICQIRAGGVGISLHDLHGEHPRVTLLNYCDSAADLLQALGRAHRSGAKSPVLQRIIFVANVEYEKRIMQNINRKLTNISAINDGDLDGYKYKINNIKKTVINKKKSQ